MKRQSFTFFVAAFKTALIIVIVGILCFFTLAMQAKKMANDVWSQLGLTMPDANRNINNSFIYGTLYYYGAKNAKNIAMGDRVAVINQLVSYAKKYSAGEEFKAEYKKYRARVRPTDPVRMPITAESLKEEEKFRLENALKQAEEGLNSPNPKIKNGAPARIENIKKELKDLDDPNNARIKRYLDEADRSYQAALKLHEKALLKFETEYPADPQLLIKKRLGEILNITSDVDYTAELKEVNKKFFFVNPAYEKKSKEWKLAFRAGKSTTDAVRAAAQQWLDQLK